MRFAKSSIQSSVSRRRVRLAAAATLATLLTCGLAAAQPVVPFPPENPITEPKRVLGKILFWDEQLSSDNTVACGTCHKPSRGGSDPRRGVHPGLDLTFGTPDDVFGSRGVVRMDENADPVADPIFGMAVQVTNRSAQPFFSGGLFANSNFWDGRAGPQFINPQTGQVSIALGGALENQAIGPILNTVEMAHAGRTWGDVASKLQSVTPLGLALHLPADVSAAISANPSYGQLFAAAFGDAAITAERIAFSIATYERTLFPNRTPFDLNTMTPLQQQGFQTFQAVQSRCAGCHTGALFTNNTFRNIGLRPIAEDIGRQAVTGNPADAGRFKVPSLRNVGLKTNFMHNGRLLSLEQVLDFYRRRNGQTQFPQNQDPLIPQILIADGAIPGLIEFLRNGLTDPRAANETFPFDRPMLASERGDVDRDGDVDNADLGALLASWSLCQGQVGFDVRADFDGDLCVSESDLGVLLARFGN